MKNKLRRLPLLLTAVILLSAVPAMAEELDSHTHIYSDWIFADAESHQMVCACGAVITEAHSFGPWTRQDEYNHVKTCVCMASVTEGHDKISPDESCTLCAETAAADWGMERRAASGDLDGNGVLDLAEVAEIMRNRSAAEAVSSASTDILTGYKSKTD